MAVMVNETMGYLNNLNSYSHMFLKRLGRERYKLQFECGAVIYVYMGASIDVHSRVPVGAGGFSMQCIAFVIALLQEFKLSVYRAVYALTFGQEIGCTHMGACHLRLRGYLSAKMAHIIPCMAGRALCA